MGDNKARERPILFSGPLVQAILDGRKTETRRPLPEVFNSPPDLVSEVIPPDSATRPDDALFVKEGQWGARFGAQAASGLTCPFGVPGDLLYVRETWAPNGVNHAGDRVRISGSVAGMAARPVASLRYRVDDSGESLDGDGPWRPSIHMPKWAARIWLKVVEVRVERVQDITEEGALADGGWEYKACPFHKKPVKSFQHLWNDIYSDWNDNPWVWVVRFEVLSTTGRPKEATHA